jgi:hypothetical protein
MHRTLTCLLVAGVLVGCAHTPRTAQNCWVESGWLDSSNGCSARAGYPDCYQVCADGSRMRVGGTELGTKPAENGGQTPTH